MYTYLFPEFLKLDLIIWGLLIIIFVLFTRYIYKLPGDAIMKCKAKAIENKKDWELKFIKFDHLFNIGSKDFIEEIPKK